MSIKSEWVPKSERGREVARVLRAAGFAVRDKDVQGHYLCNIPGADELDTETLRLMAYALNPEWAYNAEQNAFDSAQQIRGKPDIPGLTKAEIEAEAKRMETAWLC